MDVKRDKKIAPVQTNDGKHVLWTITYIIAALGFITIYLLMEYRAFDFVGRYRSLLQRASLAIAIVFIILWSTKMIEQVITRKAGTQKVKYNFIRLIRLLSVIIALFILVTFIFQKWYTAAVSLGLVSLILGFALQTPISSLIGWFYIIIRTPYRIGDRIQIGDFTGDVIEIGYLDTTLWEFHGDYLSNDVPSGRLIRFPNTLVLQSEVYNYSWKKFPYIWNEIPFHIAYESDLEYVEKTLREATKEVLGPDMADRIRDLKDLIEKTPVDESQIREYPYVIFRTHVNTWIEANVTYLVEPRKAASVRTTILKKAIAQLLREPDRVMFPKGNAR